MRRGHNLARQHLLESGRTERPPIARVSSVCVCVCARACVRVCVYVRACVRACVCVCVRKK